jgi:hypothetical protein
VLSYSADQRSVILSEAKDLVVASEMLGYAQHDGSSKQIRTLPSLLAA